MGGQGLGGAGGYLTRANLWCWLTDTREFYRRITGGGMAYTAAMRRGARGCDIASRSLSSSSYFPPIISLAREYLKVWAIMIYKDRGALYSKL